MKAVLCTHFGPPDELELADIAPPQAAAGEAVVRVKAAALNFFDTLIIAGKYQQKPPFPFSPVAEFAGVVESVGAGVTEVAPGDHVMSFHGLGRGPRSDRRSGAAIGEAAAGTLDFERAAGLSITYGTSLYALRERARLKPGETLAVLGASGGTGLACVELGKLMGARVIACASSDEKLAFARAHGARRNGQLRQRRSARRLEKTRRRARHRCGLRSGRRPLCGAGGALARLAGPLSGGRLHRRRNSKAAAQSGLAQRLRHPRRVLGDHGASASRKRSTRCSPTSRAGAPTASFPPTCTRSIRWPKSPPR